MAPLWHQIQADEATGGQSSANWSAMGISIDSRTTKPDDLFVALVGPNNDGHDYIEKAAEMGASAALVDIAHANNLAKASIPLLIVDDTTQGLVDLAKAARARSSAKIVAITGSVGKTGTKEGLACAFSELGTVHATEGNLNSQIGLPLMLARMPKNTQYGIFELGMDHAGQIERLSNILRPHVAVITTVQPVHMEFFEGIDGIADAKAEIFKGLVKGGVAILQREHPMFHHLRARARDCGVEFNNIISFGAHRDADVKLIRHCLDADGSDVTAIINDKTIEYRLGVPGEHQVINSLAILAVVSEISENATDAIKALATVQPLKGRGQRTIIELQGGGQLSIIDESYNASPAAMRAALKVLENTPTGKDGRHIAVLGDMLELGESARKIHESLASDIIKNKIDLVFTTGPNMAYLSASIPENLRGHHAKDSIGLIRPLIDVVKDGDVAMIKGSLGSRMAPIVDALLQLDTPANGNKQEGHINAV